MSIAGPDVDVTPAAPAAGAPRPAHPVRRLAAPGLLVLILVVSAAVCLCALAGLRWFTVETPSMGGAAPVGTLVVTAPVRIDQVRVGEIIAFRPPTETTRTYTHRVVAAGRAGLQTRGDINGAADGWRLHQGDLVGRAVLLLPGAGFLLRAVPLLLAGNAVVWLVTRGVGAATTRAALRNIGFGAVAALPGFVLHPFVHIQVLATQPSENRITASIVSTGLLPVRVSADTGQTLSLGDGQVGTLALPLATGGYHLRADLDLPAWGWIGLFAVCLLPLVASMIVGLPATADPQLPEPSGVADPQLPEPSGDEAEAPAPEDVGAQAPAVPALR